MHPKYATDHPSYTGTHVHPFAPPGMPYWHAHSHAGMHAFCHSCCRPQSMCCCHRDCRKESKELLIVPTITRSNLQQDPKVRDSLNTMAFAAPFMAEIARPKQSAKEGARAENAFGVAAAPFADVVAAAQDALVLGVGTAFIGGGCCVPLSVEYTPSTPTVQSAILILVLDADNTLLAWYKIVPPGAGYQIKECIIKTNPGAALAVIVANMTARVRWCEVFSC
ncbi:MAG: hypothetical protein GY947_05320 [Rhodobacteraceae bacterium]|nr:hypothetical protein [Paracoccaceae bacterium]